MFRALTPENDRVVDILDWRRALAAIRNERVRKAGNQQHPFACIQLTLAILPEILLTAYPVHHSVK